MRRCLLALGSCLAVLAGCRTVGTDGRTPSADPSSEAGSRVGAPGAPSASIAPVKPAEIPEEPLAWGTRPDPRGSLWPVVDGMCVHGEIWPTTGSVLYTYGNGTGAWTRGGAATLARLTDDGLVSAEVGKLQTESKDIRAAFDWIAPVTVIGNWPAPMVLFSTDQGMGRMRDYQSIWRHDAEGWSRVASHDERTQPDWSKPVLFRDHIVTVRRESDYDGPKPGGAIKAFPMSAGATPIANLAALGRKGFNADTLAANDDTLFVLGDDGGPWEKRKGILRVLAPDGTAQEVPLPSAELKVVTTRPKLVLRDGSKIYRLDGQSLSSIELKTKNPKMVFRSVAAAPNGDIWLAPEEAGSVVVLRGDRTEETALPAPKDPRPKENVQHWPISGAALAGVEFGDPYVIGAGGSVFHLTGSTWEEVELPTPPFAATGRYQAQALVMPEKGKIFVNAGYGEKGIGWKTVERYRAVLRNQRPKEVLRCNEPWGGASGSSGMGFMSFPPIATDACTTPAVILVRLAYGITHKENATYLYEKNTDYPAVRDAIKGTPSLGPSVELVEVVSGDQRYLVAKVPTVASGRDLAQAVAKKVRAASEVRPEVVCGTPKSERTLTVDVATGKTAVAVPVK